MLNMEYPIVWVRVVETEKTWKKKKTDFWNAELEADGENKMDGIAEKWRDSQKGKKRRCLLDIIWKRKQIVRAHFDSMWDGLLITILEWTV